MTRLKFLFSVPPDILDYMSSTDMIVREGSNVTLRCIAKGSPPPITLWKREDGKTIFFENGEKGKDWPTSISIVKKKIKGQ